MQDHATWYGKKERGRLIVWTNEIKILVIRVAYSMPKRPSNTELKPYLHVPEDVKIFRHLSKKMLHHLNFGQFRHQVANCRGN